MMAAPRARSSLSLRTSLLCRNALTRAAITVVLLDRKVWCVFVSRGTALVGGTGGAYVSVLGVRRVVCCVSRGTERCGWNGVAPTLRFALVSVAWCVGWCVHSLETRSRKCTGARFNDDELCRGASALERVRGDRIDVGGSLFCRNVAKNRTKVAEQILNTSASCYKPKPRDRKLVGRISKVCRLRRCLGDTRTPLGTATPNWRHPI